jgi:Tfp pilus assembly protein PilZ
MNASDRYQVPGAACLLDGQILPVMNISVGGLYAVSDRPPIPGQVVSLELTLPSRGEPLQIQGLVTWVNANGRADGLPRGFGIKITTISFVDKLALLGFLRRSDSSGTHARRAQQTS